MSAESCHEADPCRRRRRAFAVLGDIAAALCVVLPICAQKTLT